MSLPTHCKTDSAESLQAIRDCKGTLVLDFDYNLYLGNSTEDFLSTLRPAWLAYALISCITFFVRFFGPFWGISIHVWRDWLWSHLTWFVFPWARKGWPEKAKEFAASKFNQDMIKAVQASEAKRVIIISFGYEHVQRALVDALSFDTELVASTVGLKPHNLRISTKRAAILGMTTEDEREGAVFVTDSKDDLDLLELFEDSYCVPWTKAQPFPFKGVYVPMRYIAEGKYPVPDILWNQQFTEDFVVVFLAYMVGFKSILALPLFFISFFCVYEMGYYENNTLAASREDNPTVAPGHADFENYGIYWKGSIFAAITGALGCLLVDMPFVTAALWWTGALLVSRGTFHLFNRLATKDRIFVFPFLQITKTFSFAPLFVLGPAGALLLVSQIMRQTTNYMIYRNEGNTRIFRRQAHRLLIFAMGTVILLLSGLCPELLTDWRYYVALGWCVYRVIRELYGHGLHPVRVLGAKLGLRG